MNGNYFICDKSKIEKQQRRDTIAKILSDLDLSHRCVIINTNKEIVSARFMMQKAEKYDHRNFSTAYIDPPYDVHAVVSAVDRAFELWKLEQL
jgi:16S rRNA G966 N2-methylase RsmD